MIRARFDNQCELAAKGGVRNEQNECQPVTALRHPCSVEEQRTTTPPSGH
jgi:hypothetical protein